MKRRVKPRRTDRESQFAEWVDRLLKLDLRDRFENGFCVYCQSLCTPKERAQGICPNCRSMRKAMREAIDAAIRAEHRKRDGRGKKI